MQELKEAVIIGLRAKLKWLEAWVELQERIAEEVQLDNRRMGRYHKLDNVRPICYNKYTGGDLWTTYRKPI